MEIKDIAEELRELLEGIEPVNEESIDEKIMSKRKARRLKRKRAAAEKKAQEQKAQPKDDAIEAELVDDGGSGSDDNGGDDNKDSNEDGDKEFKALVVYDKKYAETQEEQPENYSEAFNSFMALLIPIVEKYSKIWEDAENKFKQAGKDTACPVEVYNMYKGAIEGLQKELDELIANEYPKYAENMHESELEYLEYQLTCINGFLEKQGQLVESLHPEEYVDDKQLITTDAQSTEVTTTDDTATDDNTNQAKKTNKQKNKKDKREKGKLVTYGAWEKPNGKLKEVWYNTVVKPMKRLTGLPFSEFIKSVPDFIGGWIEERLWSFINSKLTHDFVKTIMYSNPITAMIFDGDIINFGVKDGLDKIKRDRQNARNKREQERNEGGYNKLGIPKSVKNYKLSRLRSEFFGNLELIDLINYAYNNPEVDLKDKATLLDTTSKLNKLLAKDTGRDEAIKQFTILLETLGKVCAYMNWNDQSIFDTIRTEISKRTGNKGLTKKEKKKVRKMVKSGETNQLSDKNKKSELDKLTDKISGALELGATEADIINKYAKGKHSKDDIEKIIQQVKNRIANKGESLPEIVSSLIQLCEEAEA